MYPRLFTSSIPPWLIFLVLPDMSPSLLLCSPVRSTCSSYTSARLVMCSSVWAHSFQHILHTLQADLRGTTETYGVGVIFFHYQIRDPKLNSFFLFLLSFVYICVLSRAHSSCYCFISQYVASLWTVIRRDKNQLDAQVDFLWFPVAVVGCRYCYPRDPGKPSVKSMWMRSGRWVKLFTFWL